MKEKINLFCILEDIQDQLLTEMAPEFRQSIKHWAKKSREASKRFIREIDGILNEDSSERFGIDADNLRTIIDNFIKNEKD